MFITCCIRIIVTKHTWLENFTLSTSDLRRHFPSDELALRSQPKPFHKAHPSEITSCLRHRQKKKQLSPRAWQPRHNAVTYCSRFVSAHTTTSHRVVRLILNEKRDMKACNLVKSAGRPHSVIFEQFICSLVHSEETQQRCSLEGHWNVMSATCTVL